MQIAGRTLDWTDDPQVFGSADFRAMVADSLDLEKLAALPDEAYALILVGRSAHRRFPVHTKIAAAVSATYFDRTCEQQLDPEMRVVAAWNLKQACQRFALPAPSNVVKYATVAVPNTLPMEVIAYRQLPLVTTQYDRMQQWWFDQASRMTPMEKAAKAEQLEAFRSQHGLSALPSAIASYLPGIKLSHVFDSMVKERVDYLVPRDATAAREYVELAALLDRSNCKFAGEAIYNLDVKHKLQHNTRLTDPVKAANAVKGAADAPAKVKPSPFTELGLDYTLTTIATESPSLHNVLSSAGVDAFRANPTRFFAELPAEVQAYILKDFEHHLMRKNPENPLQDSVSKERLELANQLFDQGRGVDAYRSLYMPLKKLQDMVKNRAAKETFPIVEPTPEVQ